jgi:hypothetical protein
MPTKVITNDGRNAIRDFLQGEVAEIGIGTDGTEASKTDMALGNEVIAKSSTNEDVDTGQSEFSTRLLSSEANGESLRELGLKTSAASLYARLVYAEINKTSDFEVKFEVTGTVQNA